MGEWIRRLSSVDCSGRCSEAFSLFFLFSSFMAGVIFSLLSQYLGYTQRLEIDFFRLLIFSGELELLCRIVVFLIPCALILLFSTSTFGCFFIPSLFFFFGFITVFPFLYVSFVSLSDFLILGKKILPAVFLLPALFLMGVDGFQKAYLLYRISSSAFPGSMKNTAGELTVAVLALVLLSAVAQQYVSPPFM
ncbi:MAG: hypothetical protein IKO22_02450 [Oscillospiraceae bacterium]|nr:hypothetical protein [Oscillospiraceae bacterium]